MFLLSACYDSVITSSGFKATFVSMKKIYFPLFLLAALLQGCIGDDVIFDTVPERVGITNPVDSLELNSTFQFNASYFNAVGLAEAQNIEWSSSDPAVLDISDTGLASALALGTAELSARVSIDGKDPVEDKISVVVATEVVEPVEMDRTGTLRTTSSYDLSGSFVLSKEEDQLMLHFSADYIADQGLPGLYVYLTNNPNSVVGALEIGMVQVFSGAHSYELPAGTEMNGFSHVLYFCKPFGVKVGDGEFDN